MAQLLIPQQHGSVELPGALGWLRDVPLFVDKAAIDAIHDAVVRPTFHDGNVVLTVSEATRKSIAAKLGLGVRVALKGWFSPVDADASVTGELQGSKETSAGETEQITLSPIKTPQRQLEQLAIFYLVEHPGRVEVIETSSAPKWREESWIQGTPRALVFLDLPPGVKIIPLAAEFGNNKIVPIFEKLSARNGERPPSYPEDASTPQELLDKRKDYWSWFSKNFSATAAMIAVEQAASENGRIRWIDYRLPVNDLGETLHLHVSANGDYDTGTLAYNFIKRGFKHGLRLVGTLKPEPDMNVLAIYDR